MTTRQTSTPVVHTNLQSTMRRAAELVRQINDGVIDIAPSYQRGDVWEDGQRVALVMSWLTGIPSGILILSDRGQPPWRKGTEDVYKREGAALWACVDGQQRLTTARLWFGGELAVPASWFAPEYVSVDEPTDDGPYVRYTGLTPVGQRMVDSRAVFTVANFCTAATEADEAAVYLLVNSAGTPQSNADLDNARRTAAQGAS